jgi:hypothetical protein
MIKKLSFKANKDNYDLNPQNVVLTFHSGQRCRHSSNHCEWWVQLVSCSHVSIILAKGCAC